LAPATAQQVATATMKQKTTINWWQWLPAKVMPRAANKKLEWHHIGGHH